MPHRNKLNALLSTLLCAGASATVLAQTPDYYQAASSGQEYGGGRFKGPGAGGNAALVIERLPSTFRVPVRTTPDGPVRSVTVKGARGVYCARKAGFDGVAGQDYITKKLNDSGGGELNFQELLYKKLSTLDAAAIQTTLQRAEKAERAAAYRELFGAELPPLTGEWPFSIDRPVHEQEQMQLNTGRETKLEMDSVTCATPAQVDAAIATAKQVYAAVVAAIQKPKQDASSGLQAR
jgi:hypothetical protein